MILSFEKNFYFFDFLKLFSKIQLFSKNVLSILEIFCKILTEIPYPINSYQKLFLEFN